MPNTLEGQICKIADTIAYINHDVGDALRAGLITVNDLPRSATVALGDSHSARINTLVSDVIEHSWAATGFWGETTPTISLSHDILEAMNTLRDFLFERVYDVRETREETERAREVVRSLYRHFVENPKELPEEFLRLGGGVERAVVDYIAGMTDQYALRVAAGEVC